MGGAELACLDGRVGVAAETGIPVTDEGLLRGDGVFELMRVYGGRPFALAEHLDRLERSAANLRLGVEVPRRAIEDDAQRLLAARGGTEFGGLLRLVLTRAGHRLAITEPLPETAERARLGFVTYAPTRVLDGVKSLSYASNMLATRLAHERGFDEALLVTPHGRVLEAPTSSIFWVGEDGILSTPPLDDHILASITRGLVIRLVGAEERPCTTEEILAAREAFLASTVREVQPVAAIEEAELADEASELTRKAEAAVRAHIEKTLAEST